MGNTGGGVKALSPVVDYQILSQDVFTDVHTPDGVKHSFFESTANDRLGDKGFIHLAFPVFIFFKNLVGHVGLNAFCPFSLLSVNVFTNNTTFNRGVPTN